MVSELDKIHRCVQCGKDMGFEYFLGPVCGKCCRENHRKVGGGMVKRPVKRPVVKISRG